MGKKKQPKVKYYGPSAQEIQAQQATQTEALRQQQESANQALQGQLSQVSQAYNTQLGLLQQQSEKQAQESAATLALLQEQLDLTRRSSSEQRLALDRVLPSVTRQEGLVAALQAAATTREGEARTNLVSEATSAYSTQSQRRQVRQQSAGQRGGLLSSLNRYDLR